MRPIWPSSGVGVLRQTYGLSRADVTFIGSPSPNANASSQLADRLAILLHAGSRVSCTRRLSNDVHDEWTRGRQRPEQRIAVEPAGCRRCALEPASGAPSALERETGCSASYPGKGRDGRGDRRVRAHAEQHQDAANEGISFRSREDHERPPCEAAPRSARYEAGAGAWEGTRRCRPGPGVRERQRTSERRGSAARQHGADRLGSGDAR
jgi:hypothetical protein